MPLHIYEGLSGNVDHNHLKTGQAQQKRQCLRDPEKTDHSFAQNLEKKQSSLSGGDSHFCSKDLMDWCVVQNKVHFITGPDRE